MSVRNIVQKTFDDNKAVFVRLEAGVEEHMQALPLGQAAPGYLPVSPASRPRPHPRRRRSGSPPSPPRRAGGRASAPCAGLLSGGTETWETLDWAALRYGDVAALRARAAATCAPATANRLVAVARAVLRECWRRGLVDRDTVERAAAVRRVPGNTARRGRALDADELRRLERGRDSRARRRHPADARDGALVVLNVGAALRAGDCAALDLADWNPGERVLRVRGKGRRVDTVPVSRRGATALAAWLTYRGEVPGPLFCPVNKGGRVAASSRLSPGAVNRLVRRRGAAAGVAPTTAHDLRRTGITRLLEVADPLTVARLSRHASPGAVLALYDRRGAAAARRAIEAADRRPSAV